jgi:flagellar basal body rod protein FlgB
MSGCFTDEDERNTDGQSIVFRVQRGSGRNEIHNAVGLPGRSNMNLPTLTADNISEVLLKIIEFTQTRQKILIQNINTIHSDGFAPKDLPVEEFSKLMSQALSEHAATGRLVLKDGQNVKFGANGTFEATVIIDENAKILFEQNRDEYLHMQIDKMLENSLNLRIAADLLKQKQANESCPGRCFN